MIYVVYGFGVLMCAGALVGLLVPVPFIRLASQMAASKPLRITAMVIRIVFGGVAILVSNATPYPLTMKIIGVLAIMAGTLVGMAGKDKLNTWIDGLSRHHNRFRAMCLIALAIGAFLVHATT